MAGKTPKMVDAEVEVDIWFQKIPNSEVWTAMTVGPGVRPMFGPRAMVLGPFHATLKVPGEKVPVSEEFPGGVKYNKETAKKK